MFHVRHFLYMTFFGLFCTGFGQVQVCCTVTHLARPEYGAIRAVLAMETFQVLQDQT